MEQSDNQWISLSDIMTGLMVIFLFIAISYIAEVKGIGTKQDLYTELNEEFQDDFQEWDCILDRDLSIKCDNPDVLFRSGQSTIRPRFARILNSFFPRYFDIILQDKYKEKISEIRIEGHTDNVPAPSFDSEDSYIGNILLSQQRAAKVLKHFRKMKYYTELSKNDKKNLEFWLTANGLSYGRALDKNRKLTYYSGNLTNKTFSRRVEFKIITSNIKYKKE